MLCIALSGVCIGVALDFWTPKGICNCHGVAMGCVTPTGPWIWDGVYMACVLLITSVPELAQLQAAQLRRKLV